MCKVDGGNNKTCANKLLYHKPEKCGRKKENKTKQKDYEFIFSSLITYLL